jgi:hypothetical protein
MQVKTHNSTHKIVRVAGILFLLSLLMPTLNWALILSKFTSSGSDASMDILNNELLFRLNIVIGIFSSIVILALNICLYRILFTVNRSLALGAFSLKLTEAIFAAILFLGHFIALLVLKGEPENIEAHKIINHLVENYITFTAISGVFFGMSMLIYSYLLLKSGYLHFLVALSGIVSYSLVVIYDSLVILFPCYAGIISIQIIGSVPVCLFQIVFGVWLLFKGINITSTHKK